MTSATSARIYYPDAPYKPSYRELLSYGFKPGQPWGEDRRELERVFHEADRYHGSSYSPRSYAPAIPSPASNHGGSQPGALIRHPTAATANHYPPSERSVPESVLAGFTDPSPYPGPLRSHPYQPYEITPDVIRANSTGSHTQPFHPRNRSDFRWNATTGSSIASYRPDSLLDLNPYGTYRDPGNYYVSDDDDTNFSSVTPYHRHYGHHHHHRVASSGYNYDSDDYSHHPGLYDSEYDSDGHRGYRGDESEAYYGDREEYDFEKFDGRSALSDDDKGGNSPFDTLDDLYLEEYDTDPDYSHDGGSSYYSD